MADRLITPPAQEPVSVADLRSYLRDVADPDATLTRLIKTAREAVEGAANVAMFDQVRELTLDAWPGRAPGDDGLGWWDGVREGSIMQGLPSFVEMPRGPLIAITSVTTFATDGSSSVMDAGEYYSETRGPAELGRLTLVPGVAWPIPGRLSGGIAIQYRAGFTDVALIPSAFVTAMLQIAAHLYENRGDDIADVPMPPPAVRLIQHYRVRPGL